MSWSKTLDWTHLTYRQQWYLWCDQAKSVWSWSNSVFIFLTNCMHHFHSYILQKNPLKLVNWFQRYEQLKDAKNNKKTKDIFCFAWLYLKITIFDFLLILLDHITFSDSNNIILWLELEDISKKKTYFKNFSWFQFYVYKLCMIIYMWCDHAKWVRTHKYCFKDTAKQSRSSFFSFLLFVQSLDCFYRWNQLPNLCGVFTKKTKILFFHFRFILLDCITFYCSMDCCVEVIIIVNDNLWKLFSVHTEMLSP